MLERAKLLCVCVPVNLQEDNVPELGMRGEGLVEGGGEGKPSSLTKLS